MLNEIKLKADLDKCSCCCLQQRALQLGLALIRTYGKNNEGCGDGSEGKGPEFRLPDLCQKLGISVHICNSNIMGGLRQEDCWGRLASQPKFRKKKW